MELRGIEFGKVFTASGTRNFFGQGWPYHRYNEFLFGDRFSFEGSTEISKTTTLFPRKGNMPLKDDFQPRSFLPDCIRLYPLKGSVINSVGLSGPGAKELLSDGRWQSKKEPFGISFMALEGEEITPLDQIKEFVDLLGPEIGNFSAPIFLQINVSCPNTGHELTALVANVISQLEIASELNIPLDLKINSLTAPKILLEVQSSGLADVITCSNIIPWNSMPWEFTWKEYFGREKSPLEKYGGGGVSGNAIRPIVLDAIKAYRDAGVTQLIKGCGGIMHPLHVWEFIDAGVDAIELGTIAILRPWLLQATIKQGNIILPSNAEEKEA